MIMVVRHTLRDARRGLITLLILLGGLVFAVLGGVASAYPTVAARTEISRIAESLGAASTGLTGPAVNVGTMGGYVQWKYGTVLVVIAGIWAILALTGTLAGEAGRGSLDVLAATPLSRRRLALAKLGGLLAVLTAGCAAATAGAWLGGQAFARLPGDAVPVADAAGLGAWLWTMAVAFGGLAFALAQWLGRAVGAWIAGALLIGGLVAVGYRDFSPVLDAIAPFTPWDWTYAHLPLAGRLDWASLAWPLLAGVLLLGAGVEAFARRDLGAVLSLPRVSPPAFGVRGVAGRVFADRLPAALGWGGGLAVLGFVLAASSATMAEQFVRSPSLAESFGAMFPDFDVSTPGGFLQLVMQLMFVLAGFAAVSLLGGWGADEDTGRMEMLLATPVTRAGLILRGGLGLLGAVAVVTGLAAAGVALGAVAAGSADILRPTAGTGVLGLFAAAVVGVGVAAGGLARMSAAGTVAGIAVVVTYLIDLVAPALDMPDWVREIALTAHLGRPMVGDWDVTGVTACLILAAGGLLVGAAGLTRRDLRH
ncbi:ABC transporter permease subunit [Catenuloplanes atrovinosus]|uniref:ABC-2 type transport system permease protein n=1 Tax=Catenuloplanes atrovinosus TaxID=137266 RepID=A0AAE3YQP8_9ACTN|nr:ABC transporter permease subunit [Catenuloplanes atrovinosus]MDR7276036.1 ABC-2 type transport system permease protein [Catenuloplanes atrovinosus]